MCFLNCTLVGTFSALQPHFQWARRETNNESESSPIIISLSPETHTQTQKFHPPLGNEFARTLPHPPGRATSVNSSGSGLGVGRYLVLRTGNLKLVSPVWRGDRFVQMGQTHTAQFPLRSHRKGQPSRVAAGLHHRKPSDTWPCKRMYWGNASGGGL